MQEIGYARILADIYKQLDSDFDEYRKRVRERYGELVDDGILNDRKKIQIEHKTVD